MIYGTRTRNRDFNSRFFNSLRRNTFNFGLTPEEVNKPEVSNQVAVVVFHNLKTIFKVERVLCTLCSVELSTPLVHVQDSSKLGDQSKSYNFGGFK
jgi:pyrroloquinoline quinone (PQQ) biosynthesis protein C